MSKTLQNDLTAWLSAAMPQSILVGKSGPATKMQTCQGSKLMDSLPTFLRIFLAGSQDMRFVYLFVYAKYVYTLYGMYIYIYTDIA